ncbi:DUF3558 family protein [Nocardia nova]|uniref:DUF3558 family protein n=1 Tax=Nocardia nova TaxID=37330 RepID=UPI0033E33CC0
MHRMVRAATAVVVLAVSAGCSSGTTPSETVTTQAADDEALRGCGPESDVQIADLLHATSAHREDGPTVCAWEGSYSDGSRVDITYAWFVQDSLLRDSSVAARLGYRTEHLLVSNFGGLIWRDPRDPGSCGVSAADSGTVTYWVENRSRSATPDPCAAALAAEKATVQLDG